MLGDAAGFAAGNVGFAKSVEQRMRYCISDTPQELHAIRASLLPFDDVICGGCYGPAASEFLGDDDIVGDGPFFMVFVEDPANRENEYQFIVTAEGIAGQLIMHSNSDNGATNWDEPFPITLNGLYNFLRQLPRGAEAFGTR
jgi:hypothetical protein